MAFDFYDKTLSIDSLQVRIPTRECHNMDFFTERFTTFSENTGEVIDEHFKETSLKYQVDGVSVYARIEDEFNGEYLAVLFSSKCLRSLEYFKGIRDTNITTIYDFIMSLDRFPKFSYESFLNGRCLDVDFKRDFKIKLIDFKTLIKGLAKHIEPSTKKDEGCRLIGKKNNYGLEIGVRKSTKFLTHPYSKFYFKSAELDSKSVYFREKYLSDHENVIPNDIGRFELTIKNSKHFRTMGIHNNSLGALLRLTSRVKEDLLIKFQSINFGERVKMVKTKTKTEKVKPMDQFIINTLSICIANGLSFSSIIGKLTMDLDVRDRRNMESKINLHYKTHFQDTREDKESVKMGDIYTLIGWC